MYWLFSCIGKLVQSDAVFIRSLSLSCAVFNTFSLCSLNFLRWDPEASFLQKGHWVSQNCWEQISQKLHPQKTQQRTTGALNTSPHTEQEGSSSKSCESLSIFSDDISWTDILRLSVIDKNITAPYVPFPAPDAWPLDLISGHKYS